MKSKLQKQYGTEKISFIEVFYTPEQSVTSEGCPLASEVIETEKFQDILVVFRTHPGHKCDHKVTGMNFTTW